MNMRNKLSAVWFACLAPIFLAAGAAAQNGNSLTFSGFRPLYDLARRLEAQYAKPVTIENPLQEWPGELAPLPHGGIGESNHSVVLAAADGTFTAPSLTLDLVKRAVDSYQRQNPDRSRYKVLQSSMGFHIVPVESHDASGGLRPVPAVLDAIVYVPVASRTFTEHVTALLAATSAANGVSFRPFTNLDAKYAANGYYWPYPLMRTDKDRPYMVFDWGANCLSARDALIDLLAGSETTMTWELACGRDACNLHMDAMMPKGGPVYLDRCMKCMPIPTQAGKTMQQLMEDHRGKK